MIVYRSYLYNLFYQHRLFSFTYFFHFRLSFDRTRLWSEAVGKDERDENILASWDLLGLHFFFFFFFMVLTAVRLISSDR